MSVLIKGMKMPQNCDTCPMLYEYRFCALTDDHASSIEWKIEEKRMPNCPLIKLTDHGDLVDRDTLMSEIADWQLSESPEEGINWWLGKDVTSHEMQYSIYRLLGDVYEEVRDVPVVIPAERSEDE